jgi:hypothetical protein
VGKKSRYLTVEYDGVPYVDIINLLGHVYKVWGRVHRQVVPGPVLNKIIYIKIKKRKKNPFCVLQTLAYTHKG